MQQRPLRYLREGDQFVVTSMDRLARSVVDLYSIVEDLTERGVAVRFLREGQTYSADADPLAKLMLGLIGSVAEFENVQSFVSARPKASPALKNAGYIKAERKYSTMNKSPRHENGSQQVSRKQKLLDGLGWVEQRCTDTWLKKIPLRRNKSECLRRQPEALEIVQFSPQEKKPVKVAPS